MNATTTPTIARAHLDAIAAALAAETGDAWTAEQVHDWSGSITRADGLALFLHVQTYGTDAGRVTIRHHVEREHVRYNETVASCTVAGDKAPRLVARDIVRKVLPAANELHATIADRAAAHAAHEAAEAATLELVRAALGTAAGAPVSHTPDRVYLARDVNAYGHVTANASSVTLDLSSLPVTVAVAMLEVMAAHPDTRNTGRA